MQMPPNSEVNLRQRPAHVFKDDHDAVVAAGHEEEIMIDGEWLNVKDFKHPGGRIINFYLGKDATEAFKEFHVRSPKANKMVKVWKKRRPDETDYSKISPERAKENALTADFGILREQLEKEGFFKPDLVHVGLRITELLAMHAAGFWLLFNAMPILGLVVLGIAQGRCGWFMHEGGHHSLTGNIPLDHAIQVFFYGTGCGMSGAFWRNQHNKHHATPQKIGHDVDLDTLPLVMFHMSVKDGKQGHMLKNPLMRAYIGLQGYLFAPLSCLLVSLGWQWYLHPRHSIRTKNWGEVGSMALRYAIAGYCTANTPYTALQGFMGYLFYVWVGSAYIFCNFAVSHTHLPVIEADEDVSWVRYSSDHTMNVAPGPAGWVNWWMSFLNYQIEHHLFPSMPQFRMPQVSPRVRELFDKHGVEYKEMSYTDAMKVTFANLDKVGKDTWYG